MCHHNQSVIVRVLSFREAALHRISIHHLIGACANNPRLICFSSINRYCVESDNVALVAIVLFYPRPTVITL